MPNFKAKVINSNTEASLVVPLTAVRTVEPVFPVFCIKTFGTDGIDSIVSNHVKMTTRFCPIILFVPLIVERFSIGRNEIQLHAMESILGYHTVSFMNFQDLHVGTVWSLFDVFRLFQHVKLVQPSPHDKQHFLRTLQCRPWDLFHGAFHYNIGLR